MKLKKTMTTTSTKEWLRFFLDAGIPRSDCTKYAMTFYENRILIPEMLPDLNKSYLRDDLGITVLGDIISILKHAKKIHAENKFKQMQPQNDDAATAETTPSSSKAPVRNAPVLLKP